MFFRDNAVTPIKTIAVRRDPFGEYTIRLGLRCSGLVPLAVGRRKHRRPVDEVHIIARRRPFS